MKDLRCDTQFIVQVCGWGTACYMVGNIMDTVYHKEEMPSWKNLIAWSPSAIAGGMVGVSYGLLGVPLFSRFLLPSSD